MTPEEKPTVVTSRASYSIWFYRLLILLIQGAILGMLVYIALTLKKIHRGLIINSDLYGPYADVYILNPALNVREL